MARVAVVKCGQNPGDVREAFGRLMELVGGLSDRIRPGQRVLVKPNFVAPVAGAVTDSEVVSAVVYAVMETGATPVIGECPGFEYDSHVTFQVVGVQELAEKLGVEAINFEDDEYVEVPFNHPRVRTVQIARAAAECDAIINIPRMKSHKLTDLSLAIKNCFGMLKKESRREVHARGLDHGIAALNELFHPALTVMDGLVVPSAGAVYGEHVPYGVLAASDNMLALDLAACRLLGYAPADVKHIALAASQTKPQVELVGDQVDPLVLPHRGSARRKMLYRHAYATLYAFDHHLSRTGAGTIIRGSMHDSAYIRGSTGPSARCARSVYRSVRSTL
jgi:uncharacterized protein (DUF362 family)